MRRSCGVKECVVREEGGIAESGFWHVVDEQREEMRRKTGALGDSCLDGSDGGFGVPDFDLEGASREEGLYYVDQLGRDTEGYEFGD